MPRKIDRVIGREVGIDLLVAVTARIAPVVAVASGRVAAERRVRQTGSGGHMLEEAEHSARCDDGATDEISANANRSGPT